jgi:hypothetical protein
MPTRTADPDLLHWVTLAERTQALRFTAQGWALAEACALLGEYGKPQEMIVEMLGAIINGFVEEGTKSARGELQAEWRLPENGLTATVAFGTDALKAVSGVCDMDLSELQSAIQSSVELTLLDLYNKHKDKRQLH